MMKKSEISLVSNDDQLRERGSIRFDLDGTVLARQIHAGSLEPKEIRSLDPLAIYRGLLALGTEEAAEVLPQLSSEQYQLFLDLELWESDSLNEEAFWSWFRLFNSQTLEQGYGRFLSQCDAEALAGFLARRIHVIMYEEKVEDPPGPGYYTPDEGFCWIAIQQDDHASFLALGRLLAFLHERNPGYFYNVISLCSLASPAELEESAYQNRINRLLAVGIPDQETSWMTQKPLSPQKLVEYISAKRKDLNEVNTEISGPGLGPFEPLRSASQSLLQRDRQGVRADAWASELSNLVTTHIVFYRLRFFAHEDVQRASQRVVAAINIGLQRAVADFSLTAAELLDQVGLTSLFRTGVAALVSLRSEAQQALKTQKFTENDDLAELLILKAAGQPFPEMPEFYEHWRREGVELESVKDVLIPISDVSSLEEIQRFVREFSSKSLAGFQ